MQQLRILLFEQKQKISVIHTHDFNSTNCSGDIVSIQVICKCAELPSNMHNQKKNSSDLLISTNVSLGWTLKSDVHVHFRRMNNISMWNRSQTIICVIFSLNYQQATDLVLK